jgi:hypothetical protein
MKSALRLKQEEFAVAISKLISYADYKDIGLTFGDAYRDPLVHGAVGVKLGYGHAKSVHKVRLAVDLNAIDPKSHEELHDYWDTLGGAKRIAEDMNHYSFEWQGMR